MFYRRDVEADFRAFYHLSPAEAYTLPGPEFMSLAYRLVAYPGVIAARAAQAQEKDGTSGGQQNKTTRRVESTSVQLKSDPVLSQVIEYG